MEACKRYYRRITGRLPQALKEKGKMLNIQKKNILVASIIGEVILGIGLLASLVLLYFQYSQVQAERKVELAALNVWELRIKTHPNQPQAYVAASLHALKLNDSQKALEYAQKAVFLDPSLSKLIQVQELLGKQ